jgi:hypothetical protein
MVKLDVQGKEFDAIITSVTETTLDKLIEIPEQKALFIEAIKRYPKKVVTFEQKEAYKLERMQRLGLKVAYKLVDGSERYKFIVIPLATGWTNSNLGKFIAKNNLPADTDEWVGKTVKATIDSSGFPTLSV